MSATACSRSTRSLRRGLYSWALSAVLLLGVSVWAQTVRTTDAMRKIKTTTPLSTIPTSTSASISAARNEFEAFQVIVQGQATNVRASVTNLIGPGGGLIPPATCSVPGNVRLYREAIINITLPSGGPHCGTGGYPDGLVPNVDELEQQCRNAFPFTVPAGENRVIWVEVFVPPNTAPGNYTGSVVVTYVEGSTTIPVSLTVWDFDLPATASLRSYFGFNPAGLPQQHGLTLGSNELAALRYKYSVLALDHRISTPNFDDGFGFPPPPDTFTHYDARYGPLIDGSAPESRMAGASMKSMNMMQNLDMSQNYGPWASHFTPKGWFNRLFAYICDEPPSAHCQWSDIPTRAGYAHGANSNFHTLVTTTIDSAIHSPIGDVSGSINILVPNVTDNLQLTRSQYDPWLQSNPINEVWEYISCNSHGCVGNTCPPPRVDRAWPDYVIDEEMIQARALEWISFRYNLKGELYYDTIFAFAPGTPNDPWSNQFYFGGNGDGNLFLPGTPTKVGGTTDIPVATLRMKMIREGMEDFEYMKILEAHNDRPFAESQIDNVFPNYGSTDADPNLLYTARLNMACRILFDLGRLLPPPCSPASRR
jgi:hypothetical protein